MIARLLAPVFIFVAWVMPAQATVDIQRVVSPGGIEAWLVEDDSIPFMAIDVWFAGGASLDPEGQRGVGNLMTALLNEGAEDMDPQEFAARTEALAASFEFEIFGDDLAVSARMLSQNRDEAIELLRAALVAPRFDDAPLERVRTQILQVIEGDMTDPQDIAASTFDELAFGDHPYASDRSGTMESVSALTREQVVTAHRNLIVRDRAVVGVAGDITPEELGPMLDRLLGDLPDATTDLPADAELTFGGGVHVVDFPTPQSEVFFGHSGITRTDPDFFPLFVLNQAFGAGGYRSRLMEEVREERGLTYGIATWTSLGRSAQTVEGTFASSNDLVADAIDVVRAEWADIAANGITQAEMEAAQRYLTGAYPLRFSGNANIAGILAAMQSDGMPIDYIATRNDNVMAVTIEDIQRVARRVMDPDELLFVVVGQPEGLEASN